MDYIAKKYEADNGVCAEFWVPMSLLLRDDDTEAVMTFSGYLDEAAYEAGRSVVTTLDIPVPFGKMRAASRVIEHVRKRIMADSHSFLHDADFTRIPGAPGIWLKQDVSIETGSTAKLWKRNSLRFNLVRDRARLAFYGYKDLDSVNAGKDPVTRHPRWSVSISKALTDPNHGRIIKELLEHIKRDKAATLYASSVRVY